MGIKKKLTGIMENKVSRRITPARLPAALPVRYWLFAL